jgi:hypothetical protein
MNDEPCRKARLRKADKSVRTEDCQLVCSIAAWKNAPWSSQRSAWASGASKRNIGWSALPEGRRARSTAEFISKVETALQELDETSYWLEMLIESGIVKAKLLDGLLQETNELIKIFVKSVRTAKGEN